MIKSTFRDIIASPFCMIGFLFIMIGTIIGREFTTYKVLDIFKKVLSVN